MSQNDGVDRIAQNLFEASFPDRAQCVSFNAEAGRYEVAYDSDLARALAQACYDGAKAFVAVREEEELARLKAEGRSV